MGLVKIAQAGSGAGAGASSPVRHVPLKFFRPGNPETGYLSNFYEHKNPLVYKGETFKTSEHLYQWSKYNYEGVNDASRALAEQIRIQSTPNKAKILASSCSSTPRFAWQKQLHDMHHKAAKDGAAIMPDWDAQRLKIMHMIVSLKFTQSRECADKLHKTIGAKLQEASPYDTFWGIGANGRGENHLGKILCAVREEQAREQEEE